jgi:hypothetical protein
VSGAPARRGFFREIVSEAIGFVETAGGRPQFRLNELDALAPETLRGMRPILDAAHSVEGDKLVGSSASRSLALGAIDSWIVSRFDGRSTLEEIADRAARELNLAREHADHRARALFVALAKRGACAPAGPPPGGEDG